MKRLIRILVRKKILNNIFFNNMLIFLRQDRKFSNYVNSYNFHNDRPEANKKSLQEIAGYSESPEMNAVLKEVEDNLRELAFMLKPEAAILDIGCGPGLFLNHFPKSNVLTGIDVTPGMIAFAKEQLPDATLYCSDFLDQEFGDKKFDLIYSVGTLMYIAPSKLKRFTEKIKSLLNKNGYVLISYPHAISRKDLWFPDLNYNQYSPAYIERLFGGEFEIVSHQKAVTGDRIKRYDLHPFINKVNSRYKTYQNSSIIIVRKVS